MENKPFDRALKQVKAPQVGDVVIYRPTETDLPAKNNFATEIPAFISGIFGNGLGYTNFMVNLKCFPDGPGTLWRTSVYHQTMGNSQDQIVEEKFPVMGSDVPSWRYPNEDLMVSTGGSSYDDKESTN